MVSYPLKPKSNQQKTAKALAQQHGVVMIPGQDPSQWPRIAPGGHFDPVHPVHAQAAEALSGLLARAANPVHGPGLLAQQPAQPQPQGLLAGAAAPGPVAPTPTKKRASPKKAASRAVKRAVVKKPARISVSRGKRR